MIAMYCRVSTEDQANEETIEIQLEFGRKFFDLHGIKDVKYFCDNGVSGLVPFGERPAGRELLEAAKNGIKEVYVYRISRLGRNARLILNAVHELEQYGVRVRSMTEPFDTADTVGQFILTIMAGAAQLDRDRIVQDTYDGMIRKVKEEGKWPGLPPFGYMKGEDGRVVPDEHPVPGLEHITPAGVVELIFNLVAKQKYTTVQVADHLNALGIPSSLEIYKRLGMFKNRRTPKKGWLPPFIWHILNDETYIGKRVFYADRIKEQIITEIPPIISHEIWMKARQVLAEHSRKNWYKPKYRYLLTGLVRCGNCGRIYTGRTVKRRRYSTGEFYLERSYCCASKRTYGEKSCGNQNINADKLEETVWEIITDFISNPGPALEKLAFQAQLTQPAGLQEEEKRLAAALAGKEDEKQRVMSLFRKGLASMEEVEKQMEEMEKEKRILQERLAEVRGRLEDLRFMQQRTEEAMDLILQLGEQIKKPLSFERKRQIVKTFIREIIVYPGKPRNPKVTIKTYFDPPEDHGDNELSGLKPPADQARNFLSSSGIKKLRTLIENV
ncbi:MAG: recombinase family protein [Desulfotomaculales bacterium]